MGKKKHATQGDAPGGSLRGKLTIFRQTDGPKRSRLVYRGIKAKAEKKRTQREPIPKDPLQRKIRPSGLNSLTFGSGPDTIKSTRRKKVRKAITGEEATVHLGGKPGGGEPKPGQSKRSEPERIVQWT